METNNNDLRSHAITSKIVLRAIFAVLIAVLIIKLIISPTFFGGREKALSDIPTIQVTGMGQIYASPDIATVSFDVQKQSKTVADAQSQVNTIISTITAGLKSKGIADKDIKTEYYSTNPVYQYTNSPAIVCPNGACPSENQVLTGYSADENISVTVRDLNSAGDIVTYLGTQGVTNMSGPDFTIENPDAVQAQARALAIDEAKAKAQTLANQLGVHLVRVVGFTEGNSGTYPMIQSLGANSASAAMAPAPATLPTGQNQITSNVTVTYEIQ